MRTRKVVSAARQNLKDLGSNRGLDRSGIEYNLQGIRDSSKDNRMDPDVKERWLKALRSGKFNQTYERLVKKLNGDFGFCCLGVLCHLDPRVKRFTFDIGGEWFYEYVFPYEQHRDDIPGEGFAYEKWGLEPEQLSYLAGLNDRGVPFSMIADIIEEYL